MSALILWAVAIGVIGLGLIATLAFCVDEWREGDFTGIGTRLLILFTVLLLPFVLVPLLTV